MVVTAAGSVTDDWSRTTTYYQTNYRKFNGFLDRIAVLRQIVDLRASSVFASYSIKGPHANQAENIFSEMEGRGGETFKLIFQNLYKVAYICGDSYALKVYEGDKSEGKITDLIILPADNVRQVCERGRIIKYIEIDTGKEWQPSDIFHLRYKQRGAMTHGIGMIESMNDLLISLEQMLQLGQEMYERQTRPLKVLFTTSDSSTKMQRVRDAIKAAGDEWNGWLVLARSDIAEKDEFTISPSLKPQEWIDAIMDQIFMATATTKHMLGVGTVNSDEAAKMQLAGYASSIRDDADWVEESIERQLFREMWPLNPPSIEFSFAAEMQDERFSRNLGFIQAVDQLQSIAPENKSELIADTLEEMGKLT